MKTIKTVIVTPVFVKEYLPERKEMEQGKIYISRTWKGSSHLCLCGCGVECYLPHNKNGWDLTDHGNNRISISPSILQRFDCKSHYIITNNKANFV